MSEEDELRERLRALEEADGRSRRRPRGGPATTIAGAALIGVLGFGAYVLLNRVEVEDTLDVASPDEFQIDGDDFGEVEPVAPPPSPPQPEPEPQVVEVEPNAELLEMIAELQADLAALREQPAVEEDDDAQDAVADLTKQIAALRESSEATQDALREELEAREAELAQLRLELDLAELEQPVAASPMAAEAAVTPVDAGPTEEELRRRELEERRLDEAEARQARIESPIVAFSRGSAGGGDGDLERARLSPDADFVRNGAQPAEVTRAQVIANPSNTIVQGTMIQAVTETALDSSLPGGIRAVVSEDVHSYDGSRVLIPRGSKLIGRYRSGASIAQKRVTIGWDRIIMPDNQTVQISAFGGDELGRSGVTGFVDTRFRERFGSAALISLIGAIPGVAAGGESGGGAATDLLEDTGEDLENASQSVIGEYLSLGPTIYVDQGSRITVMVDRDLEIF